MKKILLIDHHDSFIYNVVAWLKPYLEVDVINIEEFNQYSFHDFEQYYKRHQYIGLILSPGPKSPEHYPQSLILEKNFAGKILGICLGFQMMLTNEGYKLTPYNNPLHGKTSHVLTKHELFKSFQHPLTVARYHSLAFLDKDIFSNPQIIGVEKENNLPMIYLSSNDLRLGFQFHPESFLTLESDQLSSLVADWFSAGVLHE